MTHALVARPTLRTVTCHETLHDCAHGNTFGWRSGTAGSVRIAALLCARGEAVRGGLTLSSGSSRRSTKACMRGLSPFAVAPVNRWIASVRSCHRTQTQRARCARAPGMVRKDRDIRGPGNHDRCHDNAWRAMSRQTEHACLAAAAPSESKKRRRAVLVVVLQVEVVEGRVFFPWRCHERGPACI